MEREEAERKSGEGILKVLILFEERGKRKKRGKRGKRGKRK
jgi:hypothetical protein